MKTIADLLEELWLSKKIHDFAMDEDGNVENYFVKSTNNEWMPYETWLDKGQTQ
tara:strand:+ start:200 stop:361 length:162 start_codon:yes stop_codon:yes gene_type:complete